MMSGRLHDTIWRAITGAMIGGILVWRFARRVGVFALMLVGGLIALPFAAFGVAFSASTPVVRPSLGHGSARFEAAYEYAAMRARGRAA